MPIALYDATIATYRQLLPAILGQIAKAQAHVQAQGLPDSALTTARLAPDMWCFAEQIRSVIAHSAGALTAVTTGLLIPDFSPPPTDLASLKAQVEAALAAMEAVEPAVIEATIGREAVFQAGSHRIAFAAEDYLLSFALPNFHFHAVAAYAILRHQGVDVGKRDYLGAIRALPPQT